MKRGTKIKFKRDFTMEVIGGSITVEKGTVANVVANNNICVYLKLLDKEIPFLEILGCEKDEISIYKDDFTPNKYIKKIK